MILFKKFFFICLFLILLFHVHVKSQTTDLKIDPGVRYDELLLKEKLEIKKEELTFFFPKLDNVLYKDWGLLGTPVLCFKDELSCTLKLPPKDDLNELGFEKVLNQGYKKENHTVYITVYKFKDGNGAYSAFTTLHDGVTTRLKVGRNASEANNLVNFWKEKYFVDLRTSQEDDQVAKEFIILASQEISGNIEKDLLPPPVAVQLPALYRVQGSERFCIGSLCCNKHALKSDFGFDCNFLNLQNSGGIITAEYQLNEKGKERVSLVLTRYVSKEYAQSVFSLLKEVYEKRKKEDDEIDLDLEESLIKAKSKDGSYMLLRQKGNLLAIAYGSNSKRACEQILSLVPWPFETYKSIPSQVDLNANQNVETESN